ncbi:helix-turn-helix domain-containing protein [Streptomyces bauhiniae]|uniref:helix-turn-helix domain-containing protein n=1 Tax=Streptomyces bauhiniae TaxID=2340725 RepID=UPI0035D846C0
MAEASEESFGRLLRRLRLAVPQTIEELAAASGVSARGIGDLERGRRANPQQGTIAALAKGLNLGDAEREGLMTAARLGRNAHSGIAGVRAFPRGTDDFVGRKAEWARLREVASRSRPRNAAVVVSGAPGTGKTTLALHAARELADLFPDGQMMVDLQGTDVDQSGPAELVSGILKMMGVADRDIHKAGPQGGLELCRRIMTERALLLVLDNARDEEQVRPLLPNPGAGMLLITSRRMLSGLEGVDRLELSGFSPSEAVDFLTSVIGPDRANAEPEALAEVAHLCAHLPLGLRVAGNWLATRTDWTIRRLADRLALPERRLATLVAGDLQVSAAFHLSYRQLSPATARLFRILAVADGPDIDRVGAACLTGQSVSDVEADLAELVETGLLEMDGERYRLHSLLRLYAHEQLEVEETEEEAGAARARLHDWLLNTAVTAGRWFEPGYGAPPTAWQGAVDLSSAERARQWLQDEGLNWLAALRSAADRGEHAAVVEVVEALHWFSDQWIFWGHWHEVFATGAHSAQRLGDPLLEAVHLNYHAWALLICESRHQDSLHRSAQALAAARRAGDPAQQGWAHSYAAWALALLGDHSAAATHTHDAAQLFETAGDLLGKLHAMTSHADTLFQAGRLEESVTEYLRTLDFLNRAGDRIEPQGAAFARLHLRISLGQIQTSRENWTEAAEHLRVAADLAHDGGDAGLESRTLIQLGDALLADGRGALAREAYNRCLILGNAADPRYLATARERVARLPPA